MFLGYNKKNRQMLTDTTTKISIHKYTGCKTRLKPLEKTHTDILTLQRFKISGAKGKWMKILLNYYGQLGTRKRWENSQIYSN